MERTYRRYEAFCARVLGVLAERLEKDAIAGDQDIADTLQAINILHNHSQTDTIVHQLGQIARGRTGKMQTILEETEQQSMALSPGGSVYLPPSDKRQSKFPYLHWCMVCMDIFRSRTRDPKRCGKCKSPLWQNTVKDARRIRRLPGGEE